MGKGRGYAKAILFGEHFVVYGGKAIALGLSEYIEIEVKEAQYTTVESKHVDENFLKALEVIKREMKINTNFKIKITSNIPMGSGLGSSAAVSVALVRAIADEFKINLNNDEISSIAFEAEKIHHGTPSGIDNTLASKGGAIIFKKNNDGTREIRDLKIGKEMNFVIGITGKKRGTTGEIVADVRKRKEKYSKVFSHIFNAESEIVEEAIKNIETGDLEKVGELMNINHGLLSAIGVSSKENEDIVQLARELGALGSKITGAGRGGSCIILAKNNKNANEIAEEIKKMGYIAFTSSVLPS